MPRDGVICEVTNQPTSDNACLDCALRWGLQEDWQTGVMRHCRFNYPMIHALLAPDEERKGAGISATMLTGCPRQSIWKMRRAYAIYPGQMWAALDGTWVHAALEAHNEPNILAEVRLVKKMNNGVVLTVFTGKMDRYIPALRRLEDYKTKDGGKLFTVAPPDYVAQLNIYAYMLTTGCAIQGTGEIVQFPVDELVLFPLSHKAPGNPVKCPVWPLDKTEAFITERIAVYLAAEQDPDFLPPRRYRDPHRETFCRDYCPFVDRCAQAGGALESDYFAH